MSKNKNQSDNSMIWNGTGGSFCRKQVGGKAYNLGHLNAVPGIRVPRWICLTTEFFYEFLGDYRQEYEELLDNYQEASREKLLSLLEQCRFSEAQRKLLRDTMAQNLDGAEKVAVRSSAVDEDSADQSFAGMMESTLNVSTEEEIEKAICDCYRSCFSPRIMAYRQQHGLINREIAAAVIIQEMVDADFAGVLFTVNPNTNNPDETLISIVKGLGEQLVSGEEDSMDYVVDLQEQILKDGNSGLSEDVIRTLARQARIIEDSYDPKVGQDMEFAIKDSVIWFLQCRAITAYSHLDLRKPRTILDNSNIIESYSGVTTPLTFTFAREVYGKIYHQTARNFLVSEDVLRDVDDDLNNMLVFFENKVYYKLNSWYRMTSLYPGYDKNKGYMEKMMGVKVPLIETEEQAHERAARIHRQFLKKMLRMKKDSDAFLRRFEEVTGPYQNQRFEGRSSQDLLGIYGELEEKILDEFTTPIGNDMGAMVFYGKLTDSLQQHGVPDCEGALSSVLSRQGNVESAKQTTDLLAIVEEIRSDSDLRQRILNDEFSLEDGSEIAEKLKDYIRRFGSRSMDELKLETITMTEDPTFLFQTIKNYLAMDPAKNLGQESAPGEDREQQIYQYYKPLERLKVRLLIRITKFFIRNRERLRLRRTYIYDIVRNIFLGIGRNFEQEGRIDHYRDVFYLEKDEITEMVQGTLTDDVRQRIDTRKEEYRENKKKETYERMYFYGDLCRENMIPIYSQQEKAPEEGVLRGVAGGGKVTEGIVCYIEDPEDPFLQGHILMAKRTDPGWTILFPMADAIIIERGSVLSHSAVIAREMGIPLVVGVRGLTEQVHDGDKVRVDGINGTIEILERHQHGSEI